MIAALRPHRCSKPKPLRLIRPKMTMALGILGRNCLVMASDTQVTWGSQKYQQGKIMSAWRAGPPPGAICVSGSGAGNHFASAAQELVPKFQNFTGTLDVFESELKAFVRSFYKTHVMPFIGRVDDPPDFELLVGIQHDGEFALWTTDRTTVTKIIPYAVSGMGSPSASALLGQFYQPFPSLNVTALLAAYVIRQAKLSAEGVGLETEIRFIYHNVASQIPDDKIQAWEAIFAKYQFLQREVFAFITGFSPIVPRSCCTTSSNRLRLKRLFPCLDHASGPAILVY